MRPELIETDLGVSAALAERSRTTAVRVAAMGAVALLIGVVGRWPLAWPWWLAYAATQLLFIVCARRASRWGRWPAYVASILGFTVAGAPCWHLWSQVGVLGAAAASMFLAGMLAQLVASSLGVRSLFLTSAAPLVAYMVALPLAYYGPDHPLQRLAGVACPLLLVGYLWVVWRSQERFLENIKESRRAAEIATRAKSEFLAMMSHEIRTPLNAVVGCAQLLERTPLDDRQRPLVEALSHGGALLTQVINDILDFSKIEAGRLSIEPVSCDVAAIVRRTAEFWRPRVEEAGLSLEVEVEPAAARAVLLDVTRLEQILFNLVSNAVKFTERGGIRIAGRVTGERDGGLDIVLAVTDSGIGMTEDVLARLFRPFEQAAPSTTRRFGGTGLGLAICRKLAALIGGAITAQSQPGQGSTFEVVLWAPIAPAEMEPLPAVPDGVWTTPRLQILVAEDNPANRMVVEHFLAPLGAAVTFVTNGREAVEACAVQPFDVILMDVQMPVLDGMEATRRIRAGDGPNAGTPILALTADALDSQREACARAGMNGHVAKPIDPRALLTSIMAAAAQIQRSAAA